MQYPSLARTVTLNHKSLLGRDVNGIEISTGAQNTADGKPIFLIMGLPTARVAVVRAHDGVRLRPAAW